MDFFFFFPPYSGSLIFPHHNRTDSYMHFNMVIIQWILNINQKGKKKKKLGRAFKMVFSHRSLHINTTRAAPASWLGGFIQGIYSPPSPFVSTGRRAIYSIFAVIRLIRKRDKRSQWMRELIIILKKKKNDIIVQHGRATAILYHMYSFHTLLYTTIKSTFGMLSVQICFLWLNTHTLKWGNKKE